MTMSDLMNAWPEGFKAGFACIVGRPNAGKSTLTNAMVGQKVAITSARPETTRRVIRAIVNTDAGQIVLVDTPGLHRPRTLLGERLNDMVRESLADVDIVVLCLPADEKIGPGDRFLIDLIKQVKDGSIKGGNFVGEVDLAPFHDLESAVPAEVKTKVEGVVKGLKDDSIKTGVTLG